jgi:hypothetical protein
VKSVAFGSLILAVGCAIEGSPFKAAPRPQENVRVVAVIPFQNGALDARFDGADFANILSSEIAKLEGFRAIRPQDLKRAMETGEDVNRLEDALRAARQSKADAILAVNVTGYDPYDPPHIAISVQLLAAHPRSLSGAELDAIVQAGSWRRGPFSLTRDSAGHALAAFETVFDAREERTRRKLSSYAQANGAGDSSLPPEREFLAVQSRYLQFVSAQVLNRLFERAAAE